MAKTRESVLAAIWQTILALPVHPPTPTPDPQLALLDGGLNLDSVKVIELVAALEERLDFQFEDADLRTRSFQTVGSLAAVVAARLGVAS